MGNVEERSGNLFAIPFGEKKMYTDLPHTDLKTGRIIPLHSCFEFGQLPLEEAALWTVNIVPSMRVLNLLVRNTDSLA